MEAVEYLAEQKVYAARYGQSDRTIKRWIKTGRDAQPFADLPPLDDPVKMVSWWPVHYRHKVPDGILQAASAAQPAPAGELALNTPPPDVGVPSIPPGQPPAGAIGTGFSEMLERVKRAEADAYRNYETALNSKDEAKLPAARKIWGEISKQLRELERDAHDILSRSGQLVEKSLIEKRLADIHLPIVSGIRSMWKRVRVRIEGAASETEKERIWQEECDRLLYRLNESGFTAHD